MSTLTGGVINRLRQAKDQIIQDAQRWADTNIIPRAWEAAGQSTKMMWLSNYMAAKYLLSEKTASEYANIILNRALLDLSDQHLNEYELQRKRTKEGQGLQSRTKRIP